MSMQIRIFAVRILRHLFLYPLCERQRTKMCFGYVRPAKIQIRAVWSESSLGAFWIAKDAKFIHADSKASRKPRFYIVKLGFAGVYIIFLIFAQKHRLWVLVRTASQVLTNTHNLCFEQKYEKYQSFLYENFQGFFFFGEIFNILE